MQPEAGPEGVAADVPDSAAANASLGESALLSTTPHFFPTQLKLLSSVSRIEVTPPMLMLLFADAGASEPQNDDKPDEGRGDAAEQTQAMQDQAAPEASQRQQQRHSTSVGVAEAGAQGAAQQDEGGGGHKPPQVRPLHFSVSVSMASSLSHLHPLRRGPLTSVFTPPGQEAAGAKPLPQPGQRHGALESEAGCEQRRPARRGRSRRGGGRR